MENSDSQPDVKITINSDVMWIAGTMDSMNPQYDMIRMAFYPCGFPQLKAEKSTWLICFKTVKVIKNRNDLKTVPVKMPEETWWLMWYPMWNRKRALGKN